MEFSLSGCLQLGAQPWDRVLSNGLVGPVVLGARVPRPGNGDLVVFKGTVGNLYARHGDFFASRSCWEQGHCCEGLAQVHLGKPL